MQMQLFMLMNKNGVHDECGYCSGEGKTQMRLARVQLSQQSKCAIESVGKDAQVLRIMLHRRRRQALEYLTFKRDRPSGRPLALTMSNFSCLEGRGPKGSLDEDSV